jgi:phosphoribosylformylglycinamidine cyclo-ligase
MQELGNVADAEMYRTFNMGIGMVVISAAPDAAAISSHLRERGHSCYEIGRVVEGQRQVSIS